MNPQNALSTIAACGVLTCLVGCSGPRPTATAGANGPERAKGGSWPFYITITPEQVRAALSAPECKPAHQDPFGHWGVPRDDLQLSIRLQKEVFVKGEPVMACVTLRNVGKDLRHYPVSKYREEEDTRIVLKHGQERLLGVEDPKPGESFAQRLRRARQGPYFEGMLVPGTQCQFERDLGALFDLSVPGLYSAQAERPIVDVVGNSASFTNLLSGTVAFRIVESAGSK